MWYKLLYIAILRIDRWLQKPLRKAVPDLDRLLAQPAATLAKGEIVIGPARRYASAIVLGILMAGLWGFGLLAGLALIRLAVVHRVAPVPAGVFLGIIPVAVVASVVLTARRFRGGRCVLTTRGVEFRFAEDTVFCPWALFTAAGQPLVVADEASVILDKWSERFAHHFVLPVWPAAVPFVEARQEGTGSSARGMQVNTRQFRFRSANEAELRAWYAVGTAELATLLLHLGGVLGTALPEESVSTSYLLETALAVTPPATVDKNGWITVSLVRVRFPALCCTCGAPTDRLQEFAAYPSQVRLGGRAKIQAGKENWVRIPVCSACQTAYLYHCSKAAWIGFAIGWAGPLVAGLAFAVPGLLAEPNAMAMLFLAAFVLVVFALPLGFLGHLIGSNIGLARYAPVRLRRYAEREGTVAIRFRRPGYAEQVLAATNPVDRNG